DPRVRACANMDGVVRALPAYAEDTPQGLERPLRFLTRISRAKPVLCSMQNPLTVLFESRHLLRNEAELNPATVSDDQCRRARKIHSRPPLSARFFPRARALDSASHRSQTCNPSSDSDCAPAPRAC